MSTYELETRPGSPGYVFATRDDGQRFEVYLQYAAVEPRIEDASERAVLVAQARGFKAPPALAAPQRNTSRDIPDVRTQMRQAGFVDEDE